MAWLQPAVPEAAALRAKYPFAGLVQRHVGLMESVSFLPIELGAVDLAVAATRLGNLTMTFPHIARFDGGDVRDEVMGGGGADLDPELSWVRAVVEGAERYSTMAFDEADFIVASPRALGATALDIARIPRCSAAEYADPRCPVRPVDPDAPIRWVPGISLIDGAERLVPAVMVHLHLKAWPAERFWMGISTGTAAHTSLPAAVNAAICEMIERDAIALTWLLRLPVPRIVPPDVPTASAAALLGKLAPSNVVHHAFDATTDLGIPTVFGVQLTEGHSRCALFVSCATSLDPVAAYCKAIREASPARAVLKAAPPPPANIADFAALTDGAVYYGEGGHHADFDFLLKHDHGTTLAAMEALVPAEARDDPARGMAFLVARLRARGMEAILVDVTADEVRDAGLWVVRVIIPDLVPISFMHRARFLGTPRLLNHAGRRPGPETDAQGFTRCPLPFA